MRRSQFVFVLVGALLLGLPAMVQGREKETSPSGGNSITIVHEATPADGTDFNFRVVAPAYTYEGVWGNYGELEGQLLFPKGMAFDSAGNVYVAEGFHIKKFTADGTYLLQWGEVGAGDGQFRGAEQLVVDSAGNVYVADAGNNRIQKFDSDGTYLTQWGFGQLVRPNGIAIDSAGNVYVADVNNARIQKFDSDGTYLLQWGSYGTGDGQFKEMQDIMIDSHDNVYVSDASQYSIQKFDTDGTYLTQWTPNRAGSNGFELAVDGLDNIYLTNSTPGWGYESSPIKKLDSEGILLSQWGEWGTGDEQFKLPTDIKLDSMGNVYIVDNHRIKKYAPLSAGTVPNQLLLDDALSDDGDAYSHTVSFTNIVTGTYTFEALSPTGWALGDVDCTTDDIDEAPLISSNTAIIHLDIDENVTCTFHQGQTGSITIHKQAMPADGSDFVFTTTAPATTPPAYLTQWGSAGTGDEQFVQPLGIDVDSLGNVYIANAYPSRIQKFDADGSYLLQWGTNGNGDGQFQGAYDVAVDSANNVYVVDAFNYRIQKFDSSGTYLLQWGSEGNGDGQFGSPYGIAIDHSDNVYVTDRVNHRVQKFDSSGTYLMQWGNEGSGDGQLYSPEGIDIDPVGNVFVLDSGRNLIQKFTHDGTYLLQWGDFGKGNSQFNTPFGIAVDNAGNVYITDTQNERLQKFDNDGHYLSQWGGFGYADGQFISPISVVVDDADNIFVGEADGEYPDKGNTRIQKFAPAFPHAFTLDDASPDDGDGISDTIVFSDLVAGRYTIAENMPADWVNSDLVCLTDDTSDLPVVVGNDVTIDLDSGENVTCTFVNIHRTGLTYLPFVTR